MTITSQTPVSKAPIIGTTYEVTAHGVCLSDAILELEKLPATLETTYKRLELEEQATVKWVTTNRVWFILIVACTITFAATILLDHLLTSLIHF